MALVVGKMDALRFCFPRRWIYFSKINDAQITTLPGVSDLCQWYMYNFAASEYSLLGLRVEKLAFSIKAAMGSVWNLD